MLKNRFIVSLAAIFLAQNTVAYAEVTNHDDGTTANKPSDESDVANDGIIIEGDKIELHLDRQMRSIGNASIHQNNQDAYADIINYDVQNDELHAIGNVRVETGSTRLTGPELRMRLSESIGEMRNASIVMTNPVNLIQHNRNPVSSETFSRQLGSLQSQQIGSDDNYKISSGITDENFSNIETPDQASTNALPRSSKARGNAEMIFFEGQNKKRLTGARYTTCAADVDDWYIKASEMSLNDYTESGTAKNAYIEFKGIPIMYTPWIGFSFNSQRKSGFLSPTWGTTSKSGFEALIPYYWNISPNMDATLAARELSKLGVQLQSEFLYLDTNYSAIDSIEYLPTDSMTNKTRYYANLKHNHTLGGGWSAGYNLEKVSDDTYFSEMSTRIVTTSRVNLPQRFNLNYSDGTWNFNGLAQKYQTLDLKNNGSPYQQLPQLTLTGNKYYDYFDTSLYTQLVSFDTNSNDIRSVSKATGTRATIYPSISMPIMKSYGYLTPKIGIHHTSYSLNNISNNLESQQRTLPIFSLDSGLFFDRDFKIANRGYLQTLEPRMFYTYIPDRKQSDIPIFDSGVTDLNFSSIFNENRYVGNDRVNDANQLSFALTSRLIESNTGAQRLSASIGQRYYFSDQKVTLPGEVIRKNNNSDIIAGLSGRLKHNLTFDAFWQYSTDGSKQTGTDNSNFLRSTFTGRYNPEPGKVLNLSYSYTRDSIEQANISSQWPLSRGWYGIGRANYSFKDNTFIETIGGLEYDAGCWQARGIMQRVSTATADANYAFFFQLELGGLASIGANPLKVIQRNVPGYVSTGLIPETYQQQYYE